jgi:hypothetical protein
MARATRRMFSRPDRSSHRSHSNQPGPSIPRRPPPATRPPRPPRATHPGNERRRFEPLGAIRRVAVLTLREIALHDRVELRIAQPAANEPVEERGEPRDRRGHDDPARSQHALRLRQRADSLFPSGEVIQRPGIRTASKDESG